MPPMPSRYLTSTARLFAPLVAPPTQSDIRHPGADPGDPLDSAAHDPSTRPWELRKERPGQSTSETYALTSLTSLLFFAGILDFLLRTIPLRDFHLIWIVLTGLVLTPLAIAEATLVSALAGDASAKCGLLKKSSPSRRTGFFFQAICIIYAAWATGETTFIRTVGYIWLGLVAFNTISAIIINAKAAAAPARMQ